MAVQDTTGECPIASGGEQALEHALRRALNGNYRQVAITLSQCVGPSAEDTVFKSTPEQINRPLLNLLSHFNEIDGACSLPPKMYRTV